MENSNFKKALAEAMINEYEKSVPSMEDHVFSRKFEKKMERLIERRKKPYYKLINRAWKRAVCTAAVIALSFAAAMNTDAVMKAFRDFEADIFGRFSEFRAADKTDAPETIEDIYIITDGLDGYKVIFEENRDNYRNVTYKKGDNFIDFSQYVKSAYDIRLNTEGTVIETLIINGKEAVYYKDNNGYYSLMWDNGDYIISISSNINKNALIEMAKSVQKAE